MNHLKHVWLDLWRTQRRWLLLRLLCALVWAGELFWIQKAAFEAVPWVRFPVLVQSIRFYLDFIPAVTLVLLLQRRYLTPLLVLNLATLAFIGTYAANFHRPLMPVRAYYQLDEGWSLHSEIYSILSWQTTSLVVAAFCVKFCLLTKSGNFAVNSRARWRATILAAVAYVLPVAGLQATNLRLTTNPNEGMGRMVFAYGYALPWVFDAFKNWNMEEHVARARTYLTNRYDRITPLEAPLPVRGHVVVLQLESIGAAAIEAAANGSLIMPFMHGLKDRSMFFRIQAFHSIGSCDMDFAATTFTEPYPRLVSYRLTGIKYTNSMPAFMGRHGFKTYLFHGNTALFYNRGEVMEQLGFDHIFFKEQLAGQHLPSSIIGIRDADVLRLMLNALQSERRAYLFTMTLDTHTPFDQLAPQEKEIFPHPANTVERYFNSIRHLDNCLRDFVGRLPEGTTVVLYGDHTASLKSSYFKSDVVDGKEYVGCLICETGRDLARAQQTRTQTIATNGSLNLLDVMSYLRHSIEVSDGPRESASASAVPRQNLPHAANPPDQSPGAGI